MNKQEVNNINFYESRERFAMVQLFNEYLKPIYFTDYITELHLTPKLSDGQRQYCFDAFILLRDKITTSIIHKFIIEIKHRDTDYDTIMLEQKKFTALMNEQKKQLKFKAPDENITVLYINFMPTGAYIFNLNNKKIVNYITNKKNKVVEKQVKTTFTIDNTKVNKHIFYLDKSLAKHYPMTIDKDYQLIYSIESNNIKQISKDYNKVIKTYSLF